jgi:DNA-binding CsgD family transcriptional regulator
MQVSLRVHKLCVTGASSEETLGLDGRSNPMLGLESHELAQDWRLAYAGRVTRSKPAFAPEGSAGQAPCGSMLTGASLLQMLERIGCGYLVLDRGRNVLEASDTARRLLEQETGIPARSSKDLAQAVRRLIDQAGSHCSSGALCCVQVQRDDGHPLVLNQIQEDPTDGSIVVVVLDLNSQPQPNPLTLQRMFGLTAAETLLAMRMARGDTPGEVARERQLRKTTIRSQLASIFAKTQTRRQSELVALLSRVAVLS